MSEVAVIDAGGANFGSVCYALERLGARPRIVRDADGLRGMPRVLLPGVGAAAPAMALLRERGFAEVLPRVEVPLLGICLGMQLLFDGSEEGDVACLGLLPGRVSKLQGGPGLRVPHMGWNELDALKPHALLEGIAPRDHAYFVHSFQLAASRPETVLGQTDYGGPITAIVGRDNLAGTQFHPEKSHTHGLQLLENFVAWDGRW